ncbi:hypothetical protein FRC02_006053 [Tulasnella sp. 418]|nr:hypothetical protein FRC02_006053 [Tulasnella sp. 418]
MMEKARKEAEIAKREHQIRAMRERSQAFIRKRDYELRETERASAREMEWRSSDKGGQDEANLDQKGKYGDMAKLSLNLPRAADLPHSHGHLYPYPSDFHRQLKRDSWKKPRNTDDDYSMISNDTQSVSGLSMATFSTMETDPGVFGTQEMMGAKRDHHETSTFNPRTVNAGPSGRFPTARSSTNSEQKFAQHGLDDGNETIKSPPMYGLGGSVNPMFQAPPNPSTLNSRNVGEGIRGHTLPPFSHFASVAEQQPSYISRSPFPGLSQAPESQIKGLFPPTSLSTSLNPIIGTGPNRTMSQRQMRNNPMDLDLDLNTPESPDEIVASIESIANSLTVFQQSALDIAEQASLRLCAFEAWNDVAEQDENILLNLSFDSLDSEYNAHQKLLESRLRQTTMLEALYGHLDTVKQLFQLLEDDTLINDVSTELLTAAVVVAWMIITGEEELEVG